MEAWKVMRTGELGIHCSNAIKIKKFPAKPEKHEKNPLRKIEGNKTSKTSVISTG